jgi:hypothetical protein
MKNIMTVLVMAFSALLSFSQTKQLCLSVDDLPVVIYGAEDNCFQDQLSDKLISSIRRNNIPAIGFVNECKLYDAKGISSFQVGLLKKWIDSGLEVGNHTYSHPGYNSLSLKDYSQEILKGEIITKQLLKNKRLSVKYFRHPYLQSGNTKAKADSLSEFLTQHGYEPAPVTVDNKDYLFAQKYAGAKAKNDTTLMRSIGRDYIGYTEKKMKYSERLTKELFGRDIPQVMLIHASLLNADYLDSIAHLFIRNNYEFVSMDDALKDKAYKTELTACDEWGMSWPGKWALSMGKKNDFLKEEPVVPEYISK